jgi:hypothetical protein
MLEEQDKDSQIEKDGDILESQEIAQKLFSELAILGSEQVVCL